MSTTLSVLLIVSMPRLWARRRRCRLLLEGCFEASEYRMAAQLQLDVVLHSVLQVEQLLASELARPVNVWLKLDSGMHRLGLDEATLRPLRRRMQLIHQNPSAALDPRLTAEDAVAEPLRVQGLASGQVLRDRVAALLAEVGLPAAFLHRFPHELSGGQKQRICIARALALQPDLLILDEPTSALDVSVQAQILEVLERLRASRGLAYLFISHNLAVVRQVCERVAVMYLGRIVEEGAAAEVFEQPRHPYTRALLLSVPRLRAGGAPFVATGEPPNPAAPPEGCAFHPRCPMAAASCRAAIPSLVDLGGDHMVRCPLA